MYLVPCRADDGADASSRRLDAMRSPPDQLSSALESVVVNFAGMVRRVAWRTRLSDADVDEVMQEVRIRLWRAHQGDDGASERIASAPASYVYRTAMSAALDLLRRRRARRADHTVALDDEVAATPDGPDSVVEASELTAQVARAIDGIPASRRPVVRMYLAGYPREEIAALMGWSEPKTRNLLYRGLADLRERLTELGIAWETET
jgi:RNA polymerase sigma-70 factor (ECF subfamily)